MGRCNWVGCELYGVKFCGACGTVSYCSNTCQLIDWKAGGHKEICSSKKLNGVSMMRRHSTYEDLYSHMEEIERDVDYEKKNAALSIGNICIAMLEDYLRSSEREFEPPDELYLYTAICARRLLVVQFMFDMEKPAIAAIQEYLQGAEAALSAGDTALAMLYTGGDLDDEGKSNELRLKHQHISYHASLSGLYTLQGDASGCLAEYRIFLDRAREVPNNDSFLTRKTTLMRTVSKNLATLNQNAEAISLLEEAYDILCCAVGPADERLYPIFHSLIVLYEKTVKYDKAELFAREALNNVLFHENAGERKLAFEAKLSLELARILVWQARHPTDRPIDSREALLDEADSFYRRSFDVLSQSLIRDVSASAALPLFLLTALMIDRQQFTPELERFLLLEIDILLGPDVEKDGKEFLCIVVSEVIHYASAVHLSASSAGAAADSSNTAVRRSSTEIAAFAEAGLEYCKYKRYYEGSGVVKLFTEVLSRIKSSKSITG